MMTPTETNTETNTDFSCGSTQDVTAVPLAAEELTHTTYHSSHPLLKHGLHPAASDALRAAGFTTDDIGQTVGYAAASANTHAPDGLVNGATYAACTDFHISGKNEAEVKTLLTKLWAAGFAAWYRNPGHDHWPAADARHVHAVYAEILMKSIVQEQVRDFLKQPIHNGLASHVAYQFMQNTHEQRLLIRTLFSKHYAAE